MQKKAGIASPLLTSIAAEIDVAIIVVLNARQAADILFGDQGIVRQMRRGCDGDELCDRVPEDARLAAARCENSGIDYLDAFMVVILFPAAR